MQPAVAVCESLGLLLCGHFLYKWQLSQKQLQDMITFIEKAQPIGPDSLAAGLAAEGRGLKGLLSKSLRVLEEDSHSVRLVGIVQGIVQSGHTIRSLLNHSTQLVMSTVTSEQMLSDSKTFEQTEGNSISRMVSEYFLSDQQKPGSSVLLTGADPMISQSAQQLIHSVEHTRNLTTLEHILGWILFCFRLFLSMSNVGKKQSAFRVGTRRVERGILVGQLVLAFGEMIFDKRNKQLVMHNPQFVMQEKEQLLAHLHSQNTKHTRHLTLLLTTATLLAVHLSKSVFNSLRSRLIRSFAPTSSLSGVNRLWTDSFECMNCRDAPRCIVYRPCLHLVLCDRCEAKRSQRQPCQICNTEIDEVVGVYVA